jgi:hypothetical protein
MGKALIIKGADFSQVAVDTIDITVGQPTIAITILGQVTITSPNGEDIFYTTDGSTPTNASTKYTGAFSVQNGTTVKAVCYFGGNYSEVASQLYNGTLQSPSINITNKGVVTITATDNASIRYTVDGQTDPTSSSGTQYTEPFTVQDGVEVRAIAYVTSGGTTISSSVSTATAEVPEGMTYGSYIKSNGLGLPEIAEMADTVLSPKFPVDAGTTLIFYFKDAESATGVTRVGEWNSSNAGVDLWNAQGGGTRTITLNANTAYVRFSCHAGASRAGTGIKYYHNGEQKEFYYDGSTE